MEEVQYIRGLVWRAVEDAGSRTALAAQWGISVQYIADVLNGRRDPGKSILKALGYERVVLYRPLSYNKSYGDNKLCTCGHTYERHFDGYEGMAAVGCKYCECGVFKAQSNEPPAQG